MSTTMKVWSACRTGIRLALTFVTVALLYASSAWGLSSYRVACTAADQYLSSATDGPWLRSEVGFSLDVTTFDAGWFGLPMLPHWVFRFQNPKTGEESRRIYVTMTGESAYMFPNLLDPLPWFDLRP